jgi:hypothetical protein
MKVVMMVYFLAAAKADYLVFWMVEKMVVWLDHWLVELTVSTSVEQTVGKLDQLKADNWDV